jgi:hypothetical protein
MININKWPVVIFASPRTGSTAFGFHLLELHPEVRYFSEPNFNSNEMKEFITFTNAKKNNYILKLLGGSLNLYPPDIIAKIFSNEVFKIKISRRNVVEQIASHYIADYRGIWQYHNADGNYKELAINNIEIELGLLRRSITRVHWDNDIIDKISSDLEFHYEDLLDIISPTKKTPLPTNYDLLIDTIKKLI